MPKLKMENWLMFVGLLAILTVGMWFYVSANQKSVTKHEHLVGGSFVATATIVFGGDVMLSRVVDQQMVKYKNWQWPWLKVADVLQAADLTVVNLESPFSYSKDHFVPTGSFSFNADPLSAAGLNFAGIDIVNLANNHFGNQGQAGMKATFKILTDHGISYIGAGENFNQAHQPVIKNINGVKFGFFGYAYPETLYVASAKQAGVANMNIKRAQADIMSLKKNVDVVIVVMHAGTEYVNLPNVQQRQFAHAAIDSGADLVVGSHPHVVQAAEIYQGKPIVYSLGNLIFDQMWSAETRLGVVAQTTWRANKLISIKFLPLQIKDYGQPQFLPAGPLANQVLKQMNLTKSELSF